MDGRRDAPGAVGLAALRRDDRSEVWGVVVPALPAHHGFLVAAGLETALAIIHLRSYQGDVWAVPEGTPVFAGDPVLELTGPPVETSRLAHAVADTLSLQSATATAAARMCLAAGGRPVIDATSRAHAGDAARQRARAAVIGGVSHTTNLWASAHFGVPAIEAHAPEAAFPNVRGALITADDLADFEVARLVHDGAPVTACAFGAHIPELTLEVERWHESPSIDVDASARRPSPLELYRYPACNGDVVLPRSDPPVSFARPLLRHVMTWGQHLGRRPTVEDARARCADALVLLPAEVRDLVAPEIVTVTWSDRVRRSPSDGADLDLTR